MKKAVGVFAFFLLLLGCSQETHRFEGTGDFWDVRFQAEVTGEDRQTSSLQIRYIGDGEAPSTVDYYLDTPAGESSRTGALLEDGAFQYSGGGCSGCAVNEADDDIVFTIDWDGESEQIELQNEDQ
ncbi:hypothetical protein QRD89_07715 [Halobacillus sp. ACCC02827]|uniref:hypothetical protein n=1 Tax=Halobacillus sp. ACCC02827 TaxID=3052090 RepID=UPI0025708736|nr:hypothetical protein [Halobacillus sp. ACCC02827]WJE17222.1 hypothetical protein QRD89_07715 [Halobacillus sp. ACCC02827]